MIKPQKNIVIVNKVEKNYKEINKFVEKRMTKTFSTMFFKKPKPHEVECDSITLIYESFSILTMKYHLEYYRNKNYIVDVDNKLVNSTIFDQTIEPIAFQEKNQNLKKIKLEAKEHILDEIVKNIAFDRKGRNINPKNIPTSKTEQDPIEFLDSYKTDVRHLEISISEKLKEAIKNRPTDIDEIIDEHFEITSQVLLYTPIFEARVKNLKTQEIKIIPVCGVTGKIFSI